MIRRPLSQFLWGLMLLLCVLVAAYAVAFLFVPSFGSPDLKAKFASYPIVTWSHLIGGTIALVCGPWQFWGKLRERHPVIHRLLGRIYVVGVALGGLGGMRMAITSDGGYVTHLGFGALGVLWLVTLAVAFHAIREQYFDRHRAWMIRNYSLTFAAVTLRIYLAIAAVCGIPFLSAYRAISWLAWVPNLLVVEWFLRRESRLRAPLPIEPFEHSHV